jgi:hypothetical protein
MHLLSPCSLRQAARRLLPVSAALVLASPFGFTARADIVTRTAPAPITPPRYTIEDHVYNGCHLSTLAFLARFNADFPNEQGEALILSMRHARGVRKNHTVALVSWRGSWWCRDEYFGVLALGRKAEAHPDMARLTERLQVVLERRGREFVDMPGVERPVEAPSELTVAERFHQAVVATRIIPVPSRIFWVGKGRSAVPVVFFRTGASEIGLYDPLNGTCVATCALQDDAKVVALAAARLGYDAREVHPDSGIVGGMLVAESFNRSNPLPQ